MISSPGFDSVLAGLRERFPDYDFAPAALRPDDGRPAQMCLRVRAEWLIDVMRFLYEDERCRFDRLSDLNGIDYLEYPGAADRYGVTYTLHSTKRDDWVWVKCFANDPNPVVPSVFSIWKAADWQEREVWDLLGVKFDGHPDLRRLLTWEGFEAHPLRKDYPLRGQGERVDQEVVRRDGA